jgi:hypothetical protein
MAKIIAERLVAELKSSGFVIMRRPSGLIAVDPPLKQLTLPGRFPITAECQTAGVKARLRSTTPDPPGPPDPPRRSILFPHFDDKARFSIRAMACPKCRRTFGPRHGHHKPLMLILGDTA